MLGLSKDMIFVDMERFTIGIADRYGANEVKIVKQEQSNDRIELGYSFNYNNQNIEMTNLWTVFPDSTMTQLEKEWTVLIDEEQVPETFKTIGHVFEYLEGK